MIDTRQQGRRLATVLLAAALAACGGGGRDVSPDTPIVTRTMSPAALLGQKIFADTSLSASGQMSCASCHDPAHGHAPPNALAAQLGGPGMDVPGARATPSLRYMSPTPPFFFDPDGTPTGGFNRDGRADTLIDQAARPFLAPHEMANDAVATVVDKLSRATYAADFRALFGEAIFSRSDDAFARVRFALQQFQLEEPAFAPYSSKYDAFLAGRAALTDAELRGLALFNSPVKGHCAGCHPSGRGPNGESPLFTDFTYDNLGVPRNSEIARNADSAYFDLGLCGPDRTDLAADRPDLCGAFKVPTLRNVATRQVFFHNGRFRSLSELVRFYVTRDTSPELWYPVVDGVVQKFDDLPPAYRANVNTTEVPYNRRPGEAPALNEAEIADLVVFMSTLTDGYPQ